MFFDNYKKLCLEIGKSPNSVAKELNISSGTITGWKEGRAPRGTSLTKIADYFDVTVADLLSDPPATAAPASAAPTNEELAAQIAELRTVMVKSERNAAAEPALSPAQREMIEIAKGLSDDQLTEALKYLKYLESQNK